MGKTVIAQPITVVLIKILGLGALETQGREFSNLGWTNSASFREFCESMETWEWEAKQNFNLWLKRKIKTKKENQWVFLNVFTHTHTQAISSF